MFWKSRHQHELQKQAAEAEVRQAHQQAQTILTEAAKKAEQIIRETQLFTRQMQEDLRKSLQGASAQLSQHSYTHMQQIMGQYEKELQAVSSKIEAGALQQLESFSIESRKTLGQLEEKLGKAVQQKQQELEQALQQAHEERLKEAGKQLQAELPSIIKELAGRAIPIKEHEKLVEERLALVKQSPLWK